MLCVVRTTELLSKLDRITCHMCCRVATSMPELGSSRNETAGRATSAIAAESFLRLPPDKSFEGLSAWSARSSVRSMCSAMPG